MGQGQWWFILWIGIIVLYFGGVEIRVMCSHCPHYAENGLTLSCWANHGMPKLWKFKPGPMSFLEKVVFLGGFAAVWGYPIIFFIIPGSLVFTDYLSPLYGRFLYGSQALFLHPMHEFRLPAEQGGPGRTPRVFQKKSKNRRCLEMNTAGC